MKIAKIVEQSESKIVIDGENQELIINKDDPLPIILRNFVFVGADSFKALACGRCLIEKCVFVGTNNGQT